MKIVPHSISVRTIFNYEPMSLNQKLLIKFLIHKQSIYFLKAVLVKVILDFHEYYINN